MAVKNVLITGISGFLGQSLVTYFNSVKDVTVFGHSRNPEKTTAQLNPNRITVIGEYSATMLNELQINTVIHLAGIAHDLSNQYTSDDYFLVNDANTRKLYSEFLKSNASKFLFLSSIKAAVDTASVPVKETVTCNPVTCYGKSKRQAEIYMEQQTVPMGKNYYILRPCMIHGPGNKGNLNLLYKFIKTGLPFPLGAFANKRSFLSIDNFNFIISGFLSGSIESGIYHLADEGYLSTTELYEVIAEELAKRPLVINFPPALIIFFASVIGKKHLINKLTEDMMVSNEKLMQNMKQRLPVGLAEGIIKTIQSFGLELFNFIINLLTI